MSSQPLHQLNHNKLQLLKDQSQAPASCKRDDLHDDGGRHDEVRSVTSSNGSDEMIVSELGQPPEVNHTSSADDKMDSETVSSSGKEDFSNLPSFENISIKNVSRVPHAQ